MSKNKVKVLPPWHQILPAIMQGNAAHRILLYGPPDTGKTTTASQCRPDNVYRVQCSRQQGIEDVLGAYVLRDGATVFLPGPIPQAMQSGGLLLLDEFDFRNPSHDSIWHSVLDDSSIAEVRLPDGSVVKPAPGFTVIATTNATPSAFSPALQRRFEVKLFCGCAHPKALEKLPEPLGSMVANWQLGVAAPAVKVEFSVSSLSAYARLTAIFGDTHAAEITFGSSAQEFISALANNVKAA